MNADVKARWLQALRSGEYEQTQGVLVRLAEQGGPAAGFCCLGVLCDLAEKDGIVQPREVYPNDVEVARGYGDGLEYSLLPVEVQQWAGLDRSPQVDLPLDEEDWDVYGSDHITSDLAEMNDDGATFEQIADLIEAQL